MEKQIDAWQKNAARYDSEPDTSEGRKELAARAKEAEASRDLAMAKYHHYEVASAAFQIGIVLASAAVITEVIGLAWFAGVLGVAGIIVTALGLFAPHAGSSFAVDAGKQRWFHAAKLSSRRPAPRGWPRLCAKTSSAARRRRAAARNPRRRGSWLDRNSRQRNTRRTSPKLLTFAAIADATR